MRKKVKNSFNEHDLKELLEDRLIEHQQNRYHKMNLEELQREADLVGYELINAFSERNLFTY